MKTAEEYALEKYPIDLIKRSGPFSAYPPIDSNIPFRTGFIEGYNYRESFVAAQREEAVKEYKEGLVKSLNGYRETFKEGESEESFIIYDNVIDLFIELINQEK